MTTITSIVYRRVKNENYRGKKINLRFSTALKWVDVRRLQTSLSVRPMVRLSHDK